MPSVEQTKMADWLGMHPFSTHTVPAGQVGPLLRGTQAPSTQTVTGPPQSLVENPRSITGQFLAPLLAQNRSESA